MKTKTVSSKELDLKKGLRAKDYIETDDLQQELKTLRQSWVLVPFLMDELFHRALNGNRTARSIIKAAKSNLDHSRFMQVLNRAMDGFR